MNVLGVVLNFIAIILIGDYGLFDDGSLVHEDSGIYDLAYMVMHSLG